MAQESAAPSIKLKRKFISSFEEWSQKAPLSVLGQTGSGKTQKLLDYIEKTNLKSAVLVSVDSIAAYKELDIGSSKVCGSDRDKHTWLGLDLVAPSEKMTAAIFRNQVQRELQEFHSRPLVFIGGTHFYERYLLEGPAAGKVSDPDFIKELESQGPQPVYESLLAKDSRWSTKIHINDTFRLYRYGDLILRQGLSFDEISQGGQALFPEVETLILHMEKPNQDKLLAQRIEKMFQMGWVEEVQSLIKKYHPQDPGLCTMGYCDIVEFLKQNLDLSILKNNILIKHRQLAKMQRTWLRKLLSSQK